MLHRHNFHHVQINRHLRSGNAQHRVRDDSRQHIRQMLFQLCPQRRPRHAQQHLSVRILHASRFHAKLFQKLNRALLRSLQTFYNHSRVHAFVQIPLRLFHQLPGD